MSEAPSRVRRYANTEASELCHVYEKPARSGSAAPTGLLKPRHVRASSPPYACLVLGALCLYVRLKRPTIREMDVNGRRGLNDQERTVRFFMPLPRWLAPSVVPTLILIGSGGLFASDATLPAATPVGKDSSAVPTPAPYSDADQLPEDGILMRGDGVWLDPPSSNRAGYPQPPLPPRHASYSGAGDPYLGTWQPPYPGAGDPDRRRSGSWIDSFCPLPKRQPAPYRRFSYPPPPIRSEPEGYSDVYTSGPPYGYGESWNR
jgi:hypothetical protein